MSFNDKRVTAPKHDINTDKSPSSPQSHATLLKRSSSINSQSNFATNASEKMLGNSEKKSGGGLTGFLTRGFGSSKISKSMTTLETTYIKSEAKTHLSKLDTLKSEASDAMATALITKNPCVFLEKVKTIRIKAELIGDIEGDKGLAKEITGNLFSLIKDRKNEQGFEHIKSSPEVQKVADLALKTGVIKGGLLGGNPAILLLEQAKVSADPNVASGLAKQSADEAFKIGDLATVSNAALLLVKIGDKDAAYLVGQKLNEHATQALNGGDLVNASKISLISVGIAGELATIAPQAGRSLALKSANVAILANQKNELENVTYLAAEILSNHGDIDNGIKLFCISAKASDDPEGIIDYALEIAKAKSSASGMYQISNLIIELNASSKLDVMPKFIVECTAQGVAFESKKFTAGSRQESAFVTNACRSNQDNLLGLQKVNTDTHSSKQRFDEIMSMSVTPDEKIEHLEELQKKTSASYSENSKILTKYSYARAMTADEVIKNKLENIRGKLLDLDKSIEDNKYQLEKQLSGAAEPEFKGLMTKIDQSWEYDGNKRETQSLFVRDLSLAKFNGDVDALSRLSSIGITPSNLQKTIDEFTTSISKGKNTALLKVRVRDGEKHEQVPTAQIANIMLMTLHPAGSDHSKAFSTTLTGEKISRLDVLDKTLTSTKNVILCNSTDVSGVEKDGIVLNGYVLDRHPNRRVGITKVQDKHVPNGQTHDIYDKSLQNAALLSKTPRELLNNIIKINEDFLMTGKIFEKVDQKQFIKSHYVIFDRCGNDHEHISLSAGANKPKLVSFFNMAYCETMGSLYELKSKFEPLSVNEQSIVNSAANIKAMRVSGDTTPKIVHNL